MPKLRASVLRPARDHLPNAALYLAVVVVYALLLVQVSREWVEPLGSLLVGAMLLSVLLMARQVRMVGENAKLLEEQTAQRGEMRFESLVRHSSDVIAILDTNSTIQYVSPAVERIFGYSATELIGRRFIDVLHPDDIPEVFSFFAAVMNRAGPTSPVEWRVRHRDGTWIDVENIGTNLLADPIVSGIVLNTREITERKALEQQLVHEAFHDSLTGLANRALFRDRVEHAVTRAARSPYPVIVLFLDLDNFKSINDSLGHAAGDELLGGVAERLRQCMRAADTVARLGGDEFAILLQDSNHPEDSVGVAERILEVLQQPFVVGGSDVLMSTSIGIVCRQEDETADELLRNADVAMYIAKGQGKAGYEVFRPEMHTVALDRLSLEADLRRSVERDELFLNYQPIIDLSSGRVIGVEALIRWNHPERGIINPDAFIPIAEETGLIVPIGAWVLEEACRQGEQWQADGPITVTVNVSARQLQDSGFVPVVVDALTASGLDPRRLILEMTESIMIGNPEAILVTLNQLREIGVRLAIDDFGTGYSSLSYLQRFPIDILKIDRSFIDGIGSGTDNSDLARAVIALGATLRVRTIAEGVGNVEQVAELQSLGCELGQGFFFAKPLAPQEIEVLLRERMPLGAGESISI